MYTKNKIKELLTRVYTRQIGRSPVYISSRTEVPLWDKKTSLGRAVLALSSDWLLPIHLCFFDDVIIPQRYENSMQYRQLANRHCKP